MATHQVVLTGVPAFIGAVKGPTTLQFFIDENDFDPARLIEVDLAKNPMAVGGPAWAQGVDVDHQLPGGWTTIGPKLHSGTHVGAVYLSERLVQQYANVLANWPPPPDDLYQYKAVVRTGTGGMSRYHGFKVKVLSPAVGSLVHVAFVRVGTAAPPPGTAEARWIDLADPDVSDPAANGFTAITPASPVGTTGALFLSDRVVAADGPMYPKYPRALGW